MSSKLTVAGESTAWESFSAYDAMSRVREIVYPVTGLTLAYAYNVSGYALGRPAAIATAEIQNASYGFDARSRD